MLQEIKDIKAKWRMLTQDEKYDVIFTFLGLFLIVAGVTMWWGLPAFVTVLGVLLLLLGTR